MAGKREIQKALNRVSAEITALTMGGFYSAGMASEGYAGGYRDALCDVLLALNRVKPNRRDYWDEWKTSRQRG